MGRVLHPGTHGTEDWGYTYDALDRLTNVTFDGAFVAAYTYDVLGNRIAKKVNGTVTRFVWRGGHVLYETTDGGTITVSYQWGMGADDLVALHDHGTGAHYYVVQDQLHSVRGLVNRDGTWVASWRYRAYGIVLDSAGNAPAALKRFRWAGAQYDAETGFYFLRTRYYDPMVGRFVQEDKIGRAGGLNLYAYVGGRPLAARDPMGTMDDYYLLGELTWRFDQPNCWSLSCTGGYYGGGGDWEWDQGDLTPLLLSQDAYEQYKAAHGGLVDAAETDAGEALKRAEFHSVYSTIRFAVMKDDPVFAGDALDLLAQGRMAIDVRDAHTGAQPVDPKHPNRRRFVHERGVEELLGEGGPMVFLNRTVRGWGGKCFVNAALHGALEALRPAWQIGQHALSNWRADPIYYWADRWSGVHMDHCV